MVIEFENKKYVDLDISGIEVLECTMLAPESPGKVEEFDFSIAVSNHLDPEKKLAYVVVGIEIFEKPKRRRKTKVKLGSFKASCIFSIGSFDEAFEPNGRSHPALADLRRIWNGISVSTVRGVMFASFKGTFLHNAILPPINPAQYASQIQT